jgi:hypothetical protein
MDIETSTTIVKMADVDLNLPELAEIVRDEIHKCRTAISKALEHAMNAGDALIALQPKVLALGAKWKAWLGENSSVAASTAALYIVLRDRGHAVTASDLVNYGIAPGSRSPRAPVEANTVTTVSNIITVADWMAAAGAPAARHARERAGPPMSRSAEHLELDPPVILLPPCGRGLGPCTAIIEVIPTGTILRCLRCGCVAPYRGGRHA